MKFFIISALVAAASAEAQYFGAAHPYAGLAGAFPYSGVAGGYPYPTGLGYTAGLGYSAAVPFGSSTGLDPVTQGLDAVTQGVVAPYSHYYGKRSAEAEPQYLAYAGLGYHGLGYSALPYSGLGYSAYSYPTATYAAPISVCRNYVGAPVHC